MSQRVFTDGELHELSNNFNLLALEALEEGDIEKAKHWVRRNEETKEYIHGTYVTWVPRLLSMVYERMGEEQFPTFLRESIKGWCEPLIQRYPTIIEQEGIKGWMKFMVDV